MLNSSSQHILLPFLYLVSSLLRGIIALRSLVLPFTAIFDTIDIMVIAPIVCTDFFAFDH